MLDFDIQILGIGLIILVVLSIFLKLILKVKSIYLLFFSVFFMYLLYVAKYTIFPIPLDQEILKIMREQTTIMSRVNLIPFKFSEFGGIDIKQSLFNILLSIPFGFSISYIIKIRKLKVLLSAVLFGIVIEGLQLSISLLLGFAYRAIDINDIILNFLGVIIGYFVFYVFSRIYIHVVKTPDNASNALLKHIYDICKKV